MEWKSRLVGDKGKDHEKALDIETKVAKAYRLQSTPRRAYSYPTPHRRSQGRNTRADLSQVKCFACGRLGHFKVNCPSREGLEAME